MAMLTHRHNLLGLLLVISLVAFVWEKDKPSQQIVEPVKTPPGPSHKQASSSAQSSTGDSRSDGDLPDTPQHRPAKSIEKDPFGVRTWYVPPPPMPAPPEPAPITATAPALPFHFVGTLIMDDGRKYIQLAKVSTSSGTAQFLVTKGEMIDEKYRVEDIEGDKIVFVYVPLDTRQILMIPAVQ